MKAADLWSQRPRHLWWQRVIQFALVRGIIAIFFFFIPGSVLNLLPIPALGAIAGTALLLGAWAAFAKIVEGRPPRELGLRGAPLELLIGTAAGIALFAAAIGVLAAMGRYHFAGGDGARPLLTGFVFYAPHALFEELLLRAVVFKIAEESLGTWPALAGQALLFGALHLGNPHATAFGAIAIALEAGVLLAAAYMRTRRLWLAWGIHLGWNATQGSVFGVRVSGTEVSASLLHSTPSGPTWLTGGDFGVEASPVAIVVCVAAAIWLLRECVRGEQIVTFRAARDHVKALRSAP